MKLDFEDWLLALIFLSIFLLIPLIFVGSAYYVTSQDYELKRACLDQIELTVACKELLRNK